MAESLCPRCNAHVRLGASYCPRCHFHLKPIKPNLEKNRWHPTPEEFAVRIESNQLGGWLQKGLDVDESQAGLLFHQGKFQQALKPGRNVMQDLSQMIVGWINNQTASAVLVRKGMYGVDVQGTAESRGAVEVNFECSFDLRLHDQNALYQHLFADTAIITQRTLLEKFGPSVRSAILEVMADCDATELMQPHSELKLRLIDTIAAALNDTCPKYGLTVASITPPSFTSESLSEYNKKKSEFAKILRDERLSLRYHAERQKINVEAYKITKAISDLRQAGEIDDLERKQEFSTIKKRLIHDTQIKDIDFKKELEKELDRYESDARERRRKNKVEDYKDQQDDNLRAHALAVVELERKSKIIQLEHGVSIANLKNDHELSDLERKQKIKEETEWFEHKQEQLNKSQDNQIARWEMVQITKRRNSMKEFYDEMEKTRVAAETRLGIERDEFEIEKEKEIHDLDIQVRVDEHDHEMKVKDDKRKLDNLREKSNIQREHLDGLTDVQIKRGQHKEDRADRQSERQIQENKQSLDHELELKKLDLQKSDIHLLADANPENAKAIAEVLGLGIKAGTAADRLEQIASESQHGSQAQIEKHKAQATQNEQSAQIQTEMLERMLAEIKDSNNMNRDQVTDLVNRLERSGTTGQQLLRDVGVAAAENSVAPSSHEKSGTEILEKIGVQLEKIVKKATEAKSESKDKDS